MNFVLDGARERTLGFGTSVIDCPDAQWVWRYYDGHVVILRGTFSCQITAFHNSRAEGDQPAYNLKFENMLFDTNSREKMILLDSIQGTRGVENIQKTPSTTTQGSPDNASPSSANTMKEDVDRLPDPDPRVLIDHALLPAEPVGIFGIPQAAVRCLEVSSLSCFVYCLCADIFFTSLLRV
jgi:LIM-domain binding protein